MSLMLSDPAPSVRELLAFYLEAGVDCALTEEPVNRLADPDGALSLAPPPREATPERPAARATPAPVPLLRADAPPAPDAAIASAREAARTAPTLEALRALLETFNGCSLRNTAT